MADSIVLQRAISLALRAAVAFLVLFVAFLPASDGAGETETATQTPRVRVAEVVRIGEQQRRTLFGSVEPNEVRVAAFTIGGRVDSLVVDEGSIVTAGQIVATTECESAANLQRGADAERARRVAELAQARADLVRAEALRSVGAAVGEEVEQRSTSVNVLAAALAATEANVDEARRARDECVLRSPVSGVVRAVFVEAGATVAAGTPVIEIDGGSGLEIVAMVPEAWAADLNSGAQTTATFPLLSIEPQLVTLTSAVRSGRGGMVAARFSLAPNAHIPGGATARLALPTTETATSLAVPTEAVVAPAGDVQHVLRVSNGTVEEVRITAGEFVGDLIAITGALSEGDQVIVAGHSGLSPEQRIEVVR